MLGSAFHVQTTLLCLAVIAVVGDLPPGTRRNTYLPPEPTKGYDYNKPSVPLRPPTSPVGPPRPPPTFPTSPTRPPSFPGPGPRPTPGGGYPTPGQRPGFPTPGQRPGFPTPGQRPGFPTPGQRPGGSGYPAPGPKPTPGFPDYTGSGSNTNTIGGGHDNHVHEPGMPYDFNYAVKDDAFGNDYSHNAISDGDVVRGEYKIQLPDGRTQLVRYTADWKNGFTAQVSYEGTPRYDLPNRGGGGGGGGGGAFQGY